ncbi:VWA domain-containing protein [Corallococcus terminator]|nr:VWA domain-containing protein [Corallococcus terminator]
MRFERLAIPTLAAAALSLLLPLQEARAQFPPPPTEFHHLILVDTSGSMATLRTDGSGKTRFQAAIELAKGAVANNNSNHYFAVWRFQDSTSSQVQGFASAGTTLGTLNAMLGPTGGTPLAHAACAALDTLDAYKKDSVNAAKLLHLYSDGEDNNTLPTDQCAGPLSTSQDPTTPTVNSWNWKLLNKARTGNPNNPSPITTFPVAIYATLMDPFITLTGTPSEPRDVIIEGDMPTPRTLASISNFQAFLQKLSTATGGTFTGIADSKPAPVLGDTNQDYCVDGTDYNLVLSNYGYRVPPAPPAADLNNDKVVDYNDYTIVVNNQGKGSGCRSPSPR